MIDPLSPEASSLGKKTTYSDHYDPQQLFAMARAPRRQAIGIHDALPFFGFDLWNHYEVSWLNEKGKPVVAVAEILYSCDSPYIIESKSMKLYFNSFNNSRFADVETVQALIHADLNSRLEASTLLVRLIPLQNFQSQTLAASLPGTSLDQLDIHCSSYHTDISNLTTKDVVVTETLCSDLLKSNCRVTNQPDWCSVQISYHGRQIDHEGLLRYLISFRNDNEFHEQCIEKIFMHLQQYCQPEHLTVYGRSTRRGGIDINSLRSTHTINPNTIANTRLCRQ